MKAEWRGGLPLPGGAALLCGFYLNELLLKLLPREDPHPLLWNDYASALRALTADARPAAQAATLRRFEVRLLAELGYALPLDARCRHRRAGRCRRTLPLRVRSRAAACRRRAASTRGPSSAARR